MFHSFPASKLHLFIFIFEKTSGNINSDLLDRAFSSVTRHSFSLFVHSQHDPLNTLPSFVYDSQAATRKLRMTHSSLSPHTFLGCERVLFYFFTFFTSQGSGRYPGKIVHVQCKMFNFDCFVLWKGTATSAIYLHQRLCGAVWEVASGQLDTCSWDICGYCTFAGEIVVLAAICVFETHLKVIRPIWSITDTKWW